MPTYESQVPLPERFHDFMELLEEAGTVGPITYSQERGGYWVSLTYTDEDLWEASKSMTGIELDDRYSQAFEHESVEFISKPVEVFPPEDVRHEEPRTERVYLTQEAARAAGEEWAQRPWVDEESGERLTAEEADTRRARYEPYTTSEHLLDHLTKAPTPTMSGGTLPERKINQEWIRRDIRAAIGSGAQPVQIGDPATVFVGSDRYPYTVRDLTLFKSGQRKGEVRAVHATLDNAKWDEVSGRYLYIPVDERTATVFTATKELGVFKSSASTILRVGRRDYYQAPEV